MWPLPDTSSAVHFRSSPLSLPDNARGEAFSQTLNTMALYQSTIGRFEAISCKTTSVGRHAFGVIPPSQLQHAIAHYCRLLLLGTLWLCGGFWNTFLSATTNFQI